MKKTMKLTWFVFVSLLLTLSNLGHVLRAEPDGAVLSVTWSDTVIVVHSLNDDISEDGLCSLREALLSAETGSAIGGCTSGFGAETIDLTGLRGAIELTEPLPPITSSLALIGAGADDLAITRAPGAPDFRLLTIERGAVLIGDLTLTGGAAAAGGAILIADGDLTLQGVTVRDNRASSSGGGIALIEGTLRLTVGTTIRDNHAASSGAGVYNASGTLHLTDARLTNNIADSSGGGIFSSGDMTIERSTIDGNRAGGAGGGIAHQGGALGLTASTVSGNRAEYGGGVYAGAGMVQARAITIAHNTAADGGGILSGVPFSIVSSIVSDNSGSDCSGTLESGGGNLFGDTSPCVLNGAIASDSVGESAALAPLALHGGLTPVHMPAADSPARSIGDPALCAPVDQRGARLNDGCMIGAADDRVQAAVAWVSASSGSWHTASNWSGGVVPGAADDVTISVPAAITVSIAANVTVSSITSSEHLSHSAGVVTLTGTAFASTFSGAYTFTGGTLTGAAAKHFSGALTWTTGTISGAGVLTSTGTLTMASGTVEHILTGSAHFFNNGTAIWTGGGFKIDDGAKFENSSGATFNIHASGQNLTSTSLVTGGQLINAGLITVTGGVAYPDLPQGAIGTGLIRISARVSNAATGTISVTGGTLELGGAVSNAGTISGSAQVIAPAVVTLTNGAVLTDLTFTSGTVTLPAAGAATLTRVRQVGAVVSGFDGGAGADGTITLIDSRIEGGTITGPAVISGNTLWSGGTLSGEITLQNTVSAAVPPATAISLNIGANATLTNAGTFNWTRGSLAFGDGASFINNATFNADTTAALTRAGSGTVPRLITQTSGGLLNGVQPLTTSGANPMIVEVRHTASVTGAMRSLVTIESGASVNLNGTTFDIAGGLTGSSATVNGTVTFAQSATQLNGSITFTGAVNITGGVSLNANAAIISQGAITWSGGNITWRNAASLTNTGSFTIDFAVTEQEFTRVDAPIGLIHSGMLTATDALRAGTVPVTFQNSSSVSGILSTGTFTLAPGTIDMSGGVTLRDGNTIVTAPTVSSFNGSVTWNAGELRGSVTVNSGATLTLATTAPKTIDDAGTLTNNGTVNWNNGHLNLESGALLVNNGTFNAASTGYLLQGVSGGAVETFDQYGTFNAIQPLSLSNVGMTLRNGAIVTGTLSSGTYTLTGGGTTAFQGVSLVNGSILTNASGTGSFSGMTTVSGSTTFTGTLSSTGTLNITSGQLTVSASLTSTGTVNWTGGTISIQNGASFTNGSGATFNAQPPNLSSQLTGSGTGSFTNQGTFTSSVPTTAYVGAAFFNSGTVTAQTGILQFDSQYTQTGGSLNLSGGSLLSSATFALAGGTLNGAGSINGSVSNTGATINVGGVGAAGSLSISGTFSQSGSGRLNVELGGTTPGTEHDRLSTGMTVLGGQIDLALIGGYIPAVVVAHNVISTSSFNGTFSSVTGTGQCCGVTLEVVYSSPLVNVRRTS